MITKKQLGKLKRWYYPHISNHEVMKMSGWKFYVFGENLLDSYDVCKLLIPVMQKYNMTMKVASQHIIDRNTSMKETPAWGVAVIYLPVEVFSEGKLSNLVDDIKVFLKDYSKTGDIKGAKSIDGKLHYRYDLTEYVDPAIGVRYEKYLSIYRGEYGGYSIAGNADISQLFNS